MPGGCWTPPKYIQTQFSWVGNEFLSQETVTVGGLIPEPSAKPQPCRRQ